MRALCEKMKKKAITFAVAIAAILLNQCGTIIHSSDNRSVPSPSIKEILSWPETGGSVYYQARHNDGFQYREELTKAAHGDELALARLLEYTKSGSVMGEGQESHIEVLGELLKQWGDFHYSKVLENQPTEVIMIVSQLLNEFWGYEGWPHDKYPATSRLCARHIPAEDLGGNADPSVR
jgi:hypothetical protein